MSNGNRTTSKKWLWTGVVLVLAGGLLTNCSRANILAGNFVPVAAPTFSITPGAYSTPVTVAILESTPGLSIRYTSNPTASVSDQSAWTTYAGPISVPTTTKIRAYAFANTNNLSPVTSGVYSIGGLTSLSLSTGVLLPGFSPYTYQYADDVATTGAASVTVTPTSAVSGQTITVNGTAVGSGTSSQAIALNPGANSVVVKTSGGGSPGYTYSIDVYLTVGQVVGGQVIGTPLNLTSAANTVVTTLASGIGAVDGLTTDGHYLYYAAGAQKYIGRIDLQSGANTVLAGSPGVAGTGTVSDDGIGTASRWIGPNGMTLDGATIYAIDGDRIRMIDLATDQVTTIAGSSAGGYVNSSTGSNARFNGPQALAVVGSTLYVADYSNHRVRAVSLAPPYPVTTFWTTPVDIASSSYYYGPTGLTTDGTNLYVTLGWAGYTQGNVVVKISNLGGPISKSYLAGTLGVGGSTDGSTGSTSLFYIPQNACTDGTYQYVTEYSNDVRRVADSNGATITIAGTQNSSGSTNGSGTSALFGHLFACTTDGTNLYVADASNGAIRVLAP